MTLRKRTLALLLTLCLLLTVAVPMVSAATATRIKIQIGSNTPANYEIIANPSEVEIVAGTGYEQLQFKVSHGESGAWVAVRIENTDAFAAGDYHLNLNTTITKIEEKAGKADVYLLADTDKTGDDLKAYIEANMGTSIGSFDSLAAGAKDMGAVTLGESFILVFKSAANQTSLNGTDLYVRLTQVNLIPVAPCADATTLAEELAAIEELGFFGTVKLTADFAAGDVVIPANVTLDTNGHTLTVDSYTNNGKEIGEGSVQTAGQGGGTVTPPAGGEGGSTVTPPAGGEGGGADTPAQTGDTSPVLFAVVALAASLLAMVALIPNKKRA